MSEHIDVFTEWMHDTVTWAMVATDPLNAKEPGLGDRVLAAMEEITRSVRGNRPTHAPMTLADRRQLIEATLVWGLKKFGRMVE